MAKKWFSIQAKSSSLNINIHDEIGFWGVNASEILNAVTGYKGNEINVSIHSPGGNAMDGIAIYNVLRQHRAPVNTVVQGVAASAASLVFMAGNTRTMPENTYLMIHEPWLMAAGDADHYRQYANLLDDLARKIVSVYENGADIEPHELRDMMKAETWIDGQAAFDMGFATALTDEIKIAALSEHAREMFRNAPAALIAPKQRIDGATTLKEFERGLRDAGLSRNIANVAINQAKILFQGEPVLDEPDLTGVQRTLLKILRKLEAKNV